jgi:hypothetical protein
VGGGRLTCWDRGLTGRVQRWFGLSVPRVGDAERREEGAAGAGVLPPVLVLVQVLPPTSLRRHRRRSAHRQPRRHRRVRYVRTYTGALPSPDEPGQPPCPCARAAGPYHKQMVKELGEEAAAKRAGKGGGGGGGGGGGKGGKECRDKQPVLAQGGAEAPSGSGAPAPTIVVQVRVSRDRGLGAQSPA